MQGQAAATTIFAATARELEGYGGYFFNNCFNVDPAPEAKNVETARFVWDISERMVGRAQTLKKAGEVQVDCGEQWGDNPIYQDRLETIKVA